MAFGRKTFENWVDKRAADYLCGEDVEAFDFAAPTGEDALIGADSVSWRIFKNPATLFIGGVAAVIMELAEPRVRAGVWGDSDFRAHPVRRLKRTGLAALITIYGARTKAEAMIARVNRLHQSVKGITPSGASYAATDPDLLTWVQATAAYGFVEAYDRYTAPLSDADKDRYYAEGRVPATLYGAIDAPTSLEEQRLLFARQIPTLRSADEIFEFLHLVRRAQALPPPFNIIQGVLIRAAVEIVPDEIRALLGLDAHFGFRPMEEGVVRLIARRAEYTMMRSSPPVLACRRLGLADDWLYR